MADQHPLQQVAASIASALGGSSVAPAASQAYEGPMDIAARIAGQSSGKKTEDKAPYFTNNEGIPWPDVYGQCF